MSGTMKYPRVAHIGGIFGVLMLAFLVACSDSSEPVTGLRPVASVAVSPAAISAIVGETVPLTATAKDASGAVVVGRVVQWATSSASVATVSASGMVTAVAEGEATISATIEGKSAQARLTVSRVPVSAVRLTPTTVVLERGRTRQLTAVAVDAAGNALEGRAVQWSSDAPAVATVSASGLVQSVAGGYAVITATVEGKSASSAITVTEPAPADQFDLVYERRQFNGLGDIRRISLASGTTVTLPLVVTIGGAFVRDVTPSPDGTRVAFTVAWYVPGQSLMDGDIYVANVDGTNLRRLTTAPELDDQPAWSPDGMKIAFRSRRSGDWDIWVMGANGTGQQNLMLDLLPATSTDLTPAWSPDGSRIAFASDIDSFAYTKLWTMRADGSDKRRVMPQSVGTAEMDREPSWSPDGTRIAFQRVNYTAIGSDIMIVRLATGAVTRLAMEGVQSSPTWSPDGTLIAFSSSHEELLSHIYTMKPDGTGIVRYTTGVDQNTYPQWLRTPVPAGGVASK
jgi:Tol biopolymer transport system component